MATASTVTVRPQDGAVVGALGRLKLRSFGSPVLRGTELAQAVSRFAGRAAERARAQQVAAAGVLVFIATSPFRRGDAQYSRSISMPLLRPTADTAALAATAVAGLRSIYRKGYRYAKAGVMLLELQPQALRQSELDLASPNAPREYRRDRTTLMTAMDRLNRRYGRGALALADTEQRFGERAWETKAERRTPRYTTRWSELPLARA